MNIIRWFLNRTRQYINYGRDQFNFENFSGSFFVQQPEAARPGNERDLLKGVKEEVDSRLTQSLHNRELIHQTKQMQPEQVNRLWDADVKIGSKPTETLSPQTSIREVFERSEVGRKLLILGEPGVGKTTMMLKLAESLIDKADQDINEPIPVLLNLSSWKDLRQSMSASAWLVEELHSKYGMRRNLGKRWIKQKKLLPLLDGLDEVKQEYQVGCVRALNDWLQSESRPQSLVVCSRREAYEKVVRGRWQDIEALEEEIDNPQEETRLHLNGAILLKTLTDEQIKEYLERVDLVDLWQVLQRDAAVNNINTSTRELNLLELMRTPLFLLTLVFIFFEDNLDSQERQKLISSITQPQHLFNAYWNKEIKRPLIRNSKEQEKGIKSRTYGKRQPPNKEQTRKWLVYLAKQLQRESQTEFLIEKMQPSWLKTDKQKRLYRLSIVLIFGPIYGLIYGLIFELISGLISGLSNDVRIFVLIFGLIVGLSFVQELGLEDKIKLVETFNWSFRKAKKDLFNWLSFGGILQLTYELSDKQSNMLIVRLGIVLSAVLSSGLITSEVDIKTRPNQGIWKAAINSFLLILISGLIGMLIGVLIHSPIAYLDVWLIAGLSLGLILGENIGLKSVIQHFCLRLTLYYQIRSIPWNYARFLNYCTERNLLQQVGGRYRFIHKLLQDYFAEMQIDTRVN